MGRSGGEERRTPKSIHKHKLISQQQHLAVAFPGGQAVFAGRLGGGEEALGEADFVRVGGPAIDEAVEGLDFRGGGGRAGRRRGVQRRRGFCPEGGAVWEGKRPPPAPRGGRGGGRWSRGGAE